MTESERIEYQAETARLRAANEIRIQQDAEALVTYDKATRDALQSLRDTDHGTAIVEYRRVLAGRYLDRACEICSDDQRAQHTNRDHTDAVNTDHTTAVLANVMYDTSAPAYVVETAVMMLRPENNRADVVTMDHADAIVENGSL